MQEQKNQIQAFGFGDALVRVVMIKGEMWWVAKDVCACLEIDNHRQALTRLDEDEVISNDVIDALGRPQETSLVNESGLYSLILGSRKPEAKVFKRWVTHEVLPSIRKTGGYGVQPAALTEADKEAIAKRAAQLAYERLASKVPARDKQAALFAMRYESAPDTVALWTSACCVLLPLDTPRREWARAGVAYKHYCGWCLDHAHTPINNRAFLGRLMRMGVRSKRISVTLYSIAILPLSTNGRAA